MPDQRVKKKNLRASEFLALLKITGFSGKYREAGTSDELTTDVQKQVVKQALEPERARPDSSFKIKDSLRQVSQAQPDIKIKSAVEKKVQVEERETIDEAGVVTALERYIADHKPEPTIAIALKTHRPLIEGEKITLAVDNQLQLDKLKSLEVHLHNVLIKVLNNGFLTLHFTLFDDKTTKEEKKLFTASEKFEHFLKLNPVVADLKNIFGLELD